MGSSVLGYGGGGGGGGVDKTCGKSDFQFNLHEIE